MHDDVAAARASVRAAHVAWVAELTRLIALKITPNAITERGDLDTIAEALDEAALSLELLGAIRDAMCEATDRMRIAMSASETT